jgi:hypothetical protein
MQMLLCGGGLGGELSRGKDSARCGPASDASRWIMWPAISKSAHEASEAAAFLRRKTNFSPRGSLRMRTGTRCACKYGQVGSAWDAQGVMCGRHGGRAVGSSWAEKEAEAEKGAASTRTTNEQAGNDLRVLLRGKVRKGE